MHFISAKLQSKNLKQRYDWRGGLLGPPSGYALALNTLLIAYSEIINLLSSYYLMPRLHLAV